MSAQSLQRITKSCFVESQRGLLLWITNVLLHVVLFDPLPNAVFDSWLALVIHHFGRFVVKLDFHIIEWTLTLTIVQVKWLCQGIAIIESFWMLNVVSLIGTSSKIHKQVPEMSIILANFKAYLFILLFAQLTATLIPDISPVLAHINWLFFLSTLKCSSQVAPLFFVVKICIHLI